MSHDVTEHRSCSTVTVSCTVSTGYQNWKKATSLFKMHNASVEHKYAMTAWNEWTVQKESGSTICNALSDGHSKIVRENREYMRVVVESLRYTA